MELFINKNYFGNVAFDSYEDIIEKVANTTQLTPDEFYAEQNGRLLTKDSPLNDNIPIYCILRCNGGKGGFGSMLRAIGAQIEKTTNREACRDLSGRRLRDINEEKRLKAWLEKQGEREREAEERKKRKIQKLLAVPKHEFKDKEYEESRAKLSEKVNDAVEEGFRKVQEMKQSAKDTENPSSSKALRTDLKRKMDFKCGLPKKKAALWIDDDISDTDSSNTSSDVDPDDKIDLCKTTKSVSKSTTTTTTILINTDLDIDKNKSSQEALDKQDFGEQCQGDELGSDNNDISQCDSTNGGNISKSNIILENKH